MRVSVTCVVTVEVDFEDDGVMVITDQIHDAVKLKLPSEVEFDEMLGWEPQP